MPRIIDRRRFMKVAASAGAGLGLATSLGRVAAGKANDKVVLGVMGTGGRGTGLAKLFEQQPEVEVAYVCDVDKHRVDHAVAEVNQVKGRTPKAVTDFRHILDDKSVDALVIATCNHWHAPATILACAAGKHVYVEKPCSHNPREGELMVAAARKYDRVVQMGNQRRSWPKLIEAIGLVRGGTIGRAYFAQGFYNNT